jgi:RNA polymerase sigma-70 factor, ECF subfamily
MEGQGSFPYCVIHARAFTEREDLRFLKEITVATCVISANDANVIPATRTDAVENPQLSLVRRAQLGDEDAFAALFRQHKSRVYSVCLLMTKDVAEAEDLTQEAFLQVFRTVGSFRGEAAFSTWLYRVAVNTVLMKLRRRKSPPTVSLDEPVNSESPSLRRDIGCNDPDLTGLVDRITLKRALQELPEGCRTIFALHEVEGYQHHEIAKLLDCSIGNSKSQLHKAKSKMRALLFPKAKIRIRRRAIPQADRKPVRSTETVIEAIRSRLTKAM